MTINKYFRDELLFLRDQGKEFTEIYPHLARFLNGRSMDPDVERLLEGFAFLTGKLREKVDDEFPELTHSIISMLWPNYLRPVPSVSILRFYPKNNFSSRHEIDREVYVESREQDKTGLKCQFRTCREVEIYPMTCERIHAVHSKDASKINLDLVFLQQGASVGAIGLDSLRFYLGGDIYSAENLYLWLGHYLESIEIEYEGGNITLPSSVYNVVGFEADDELLPYPKNVYQGYRIIQEYLSFPNAFLFFDLKNIGQFIPEHIIDRFTIRFVFSRTLPSSCLISDDSFVLYATPIINLFEHDSDPIDLTGKNTEHRIVPSNNKSNSLEIFSIDHVQGLQDIKEAGKPGQHRVYTPFESFQHEIELARNRVALYYRIRLKEQLREGHFEHFISFVRGDETSSYLEGEAVTIELTCTNKQKPSELSIGDINVSTSSFPPIADAENITIPTQTIRPVLDGSLLWALISNLSLNYLSLLDKSALCSVLRTYDFRSLVDHQAARVSRQRMEGIVKIESEPLDKLIKGLPVRGLLSKITMDPKSFRSEGDLYLFGMVLSRFFSLYANINSFHELVVINADSNEKYNYGDQQGIQPLI